MGIKIEIEIPDFNTAGSRIDPGAYIASAMAALGFHCSADTALDKAVEIARAHGRLDAEYDVAMGMPGRSVYPSTDASEATLPSADEEVRVATRAESEAWADRVMAGAAPAEDPAPKRRGRPRKSEPASEPAEEAAAPLEGEVLPPVPEPEPEKPEAPVIEAKAVSEPLTYAACRERVMALAIDFPDSPQVSRSIMNEMGFSKLSELPPERYGELLERVEAAVKS